MKSRGPYHRHSTQFKLQLCQDIRSGVIGRRDAQRTDSVSANLLQLWLTQFDRGELNNEEAEARIAALERKAGQSEPALVSGLDVIRPAEVFTFTMVCLLRRKRDTGCFGFRLGLTAPGTYCLLQQILWRITRSNSGIKGGHCGSRCVKRQRRTA